MNQLDNFRKRDIFREDGEDDTGEFFHAVGHGDIEVFTLIAFFINVGTEGRTVEISHAGSEVKSVSEVFRAVLDHRGTCSGKLA